MKELSGGLDLRVGKEIVALTNIDKVYWPEDGYTKGDLIRYYYEIAKYILPYLKDRPLILKRYPNGNASPIGGRALLCAPASGRDRFSAAGLGRGQPGKDQPAGLHD